jgi:hypothetical protein
MIFLIDKTVTEWDERDWCEECSDDPAGQRWLCRSRPHERKPKAFAFTWTLCRKEKGEPGDAICRSVESWPTERQCRAAINVAKKAMGGVRFAQTRVKADDDA